MKKKVILLLVTLFILVNGTNAFAAAFEETYINGKYTCANTLLFNDYASSYTLCDDKNAFVSVELIYQYIDIATGDFFIDISKNSGYEFSEVTLTVPSAQQYWSYSAFATHYVKRGTIEWNAYTDAYNY